MGLENPPRRLMIRNVQREDVQRKAGVAQG
jgi:hypothetical protein